MFLDNLDKPNDNGTPVMITSCRVPIGRTRSVDAGAAPPRRHTASYVEQHNQSNFPNTIGITCTGGSHEGNHEDVQLPFPCFLDKCEVSEAKVVEHPAVATLTGGVMLLCHGARDTGVILVPKCSRSSRGAMRG